MATSELLDALNPHVTRPRTAYSSPDLPHSTPPVPIEALTLIDTRVLSEPSISEPAVATIRYVQQLFLDLYPFEQFVALNPLRLPLSKNYSEHWPLLNKFRKASESGELPGRRRQKPNIVGGKPSLKVTLLDINKRLPI